MKVPKPAKIIIFTAGPTNLERITLFKSIHGHPELQLVGIICDQFKVSPLKRSRFLLKKWGFFEFLRSVSWHIVLRLWNLLFLPFERWHDFFVKPQNQESIESFANENGIPLLKIKDINDPTNESKLKSFQADLAIIAGGRILKPFVLKSARLGTLNIHKHDTRLFRGGPQVGYIEKIFQKNQLGVTIHYAVPEVDAGSIIEMDFVDIEKLDTNESLEIKAGILGIQLYLKAILKVINGEANTSPPDLSKSQVFYTTPYWPRYRMWKAIKNQQIRTVQAINTLGIINVAASFYRAIRQIYFYMALPYLAKKRKDLESQEKAPIVIFYYHGLSNKGENWMTLPLEVFWQHIEYAKTYFDVISLTEAVRRLKQGKNKKTAVVFTFDDGYRSCHKHLRPLAETYGLSATCFICAKASREGLFLKHDIEKGYKNIPLMNEQEVKDCFHAGIEIGSHAEEHENMALLDQELCNKVYGLRLHVESSRIFG